MLYKHFPVSERNESQWNMPLVHERTRAHQSLRLGNFQHVNDFWFPKNLKEGDVVQAWIPTCPDPRFDEKALYPRNCLVLGIDIDRELAEPVGMKLMLFSYNCRDVSDHDFVFDPATEENRFKIHGFRKEAVLRTGRIVSVPFDSEQLNFYMNKTGWIDESIFPVFAKAIEKGYVAQREYKQDKKIELYDTSNIICVPSLDPRYYSQDHDNLDVWDDNFGLTIEDITAEEWGALLDRLETNYIAREFKRPDVLRHEKEEIRDEKRALKWMQRDKRKFINQLLFSGKHKKGFKNLSADEMKHAIDNALAQHKKDEGDVIPEIEDMWGENGMVLRRSDVESLKSILYRRFGVPEEEKKLDLDAVFAQTIDPDSIADLQTLGIGGLNRGADVNIPEHLWKGRYVMARIADLWDPENYNEAYRPCIVTKAYAKLNENKEPVLAGLEMHPCTRQAAETFSFKMPVYPFGYRKGKRENTQQSFLIADMVIRLSVDDKNFQRDMVTDNFRELTPDMVEKFDRKVAHAKDSRGDDLKVFGLEEIPDSWVEISLPFTPNTSIQEKLHQWKKARFVPA